MSREDLHAGHPVDDPFGDLGTSPAAPGPDLPGAAGEQPEGPADARSFAEIVDGTTTTVVDTETGEVLAEAQVPRGGPVAGGRRAPIAKAAPLPRWADPSPQDDGDGADGDVDYSDLAALNRDLLRLRVRMNRIRRAMRDAARESVEAKLAYQRALRRALVQQSGGSAETRKAAAELMCEDLEAEMVMKAQVAEEYTTLFRSVRDDIENAKVVAYNLRALSNLM